VIKRLCLEYEVTFVLSWQLFFLAQLFSLNLGFNVFIKILLAVLSPLSIRPELMQVINVCTCGGEKQISPDPLFESWERC
jgi:hypothetical protein